MIAVPVVHAVTDDEILLRDDFAAMCREVASALGDRGAVHLRSRWLSGRRLYEFALLLSECEQSTGCWAIVNDRLDVALAAGVRAVQLTSHSAAPAEARRLGPAFRVGASVHSVADSRIAERDGADWCIAGTAFPTASHPGEPAGGPALMREIAASVRIPVIAIGGVTPERVTELAGTGIHGVATIRGIWNASNVREASLSYLSAYAVSGNTGTD
jgi:thiazole tautomerase (transcriptional regulator TenI)